MLKVTSILAVAALASTPAISFAFDGPDQGEGGTFTPPKLVVPEDMNGEHIELHTSLEDAYIAKKAGVEIVSELTAIDTDTSIVIEEIKSLYVIGNGITLTD